MPRSTYSDRAATVAVILLQIHDDARCDRRELQRRYEEVLREEIADAEQQAVADRADPQPGGE